MASIINQPDQRDTEIDMLMIPYSDFEHISRDRDQAVALVESVFTTLSNQNVPAVDRVASARELIQVKINNTYSSIPPFIS